MTGLRGCAAARIVEKHYLPQLLVAVVAARPVATALAAVSHTKFP